VAPAYPKAGLLASRDEKLFVQGVTAYMQQRYADALSALQEAAGKDVKGSHIGEELFAALCLVQLERAPEAEAYLETVLASDHGLPDPIMRKYNVGGEMVIGVTPAVVATVPMSNLGVALMLAEVYQHTGNREKAIELMESLGAEAPAQPIFALSLSDLYLDGDQWDEVIRVTDGVHANEDDVSLNILAYRAEAMVEQGLGDAALALTKECLRTKKRNPLLLRYARYLRGRAYEVTGKAGMARKEFEKVYAEDADFSDIAQRLGMDKATKRDPTPARPDL
jgi:tetratricopeptide (TPR) repeat protein